MPRAEARLRFKGSPQSVGVPGFIARWASAWTTVAAAVRR